ncbi:hypothetical protein LIER_18286 [Lithospermum erythrorhizon]|uniref:Uncharacterized protein n=1 Tax=Lithospermum erythrorhizon TaxID=34254 RepID=A0AAV3QG83_LITER
MNIALLAKQGWRVATKEASLLFKVLKGRYFKRSSFLHAKLGSNSSYGWRSLLERRNVLLKGVRWQVGDGRSIDVWKEPWVSRRGDFRVHGRGSNEVQWVSQFIRNGQWNRNIVLQVLGPEDAKIILAIPLSRMPTRDKLV